MPRAYWGMVSAICVFLFLVPNDARLPAMQFQMWSAFFGAFGVFSALEALAPSDHER